MEIVRPTQAEYQVPSLKKGFSMRKFAFIPLLLIIVVAGIGTGYGINKLTNKKVAGSTNVTGAPGTMNQSQLVVGKVYGIDDSKKFPGDGTEGVIQKGGLDGEGTHHLVRPGGASQTAYLTSSVVDLDLFVGSKVVIKGDTLAAQKAAWFIDVGNVKLIELNSQKAADTTSQATTPAE